jgi:hypothetical protein
MPKNKIVKCESCGHTLKSESQLGNDKPYVYYCDNPECEMYQKI